MGICIPPTHWPIRGHRHMGLPSHMSIPTPAMYQSQQGQHGTATLLLQCNESPMQQADFLSYHTVHNQWLFHLSLKCMNNIIITCWDMTVVNMNSLVKHTVTQCIMFMSVSTYGALLPAGPVGLM